jgi:hypothetical protein
MGIIDDTWGIAAFNAERLRQITEEGYTPEQDVGHSEELARAGACYADFAAGQLEGADQDEPHAFWPWDDSAWKPGSTPLRTMEKAGSLLAAAYDALLAEISQGIIDAGD